jgi:putative PIN family toxin of toxin-antitoxin system
MRAVLDPGVLVSAFLSDQGAPAKLYLRWLDGSYDLVVCPKLIAELEGVLKRDKFRQYSTVEEAEAFVDVFRRGAVMVADPTSPAGGSRDATDNDLVALAQEAKVDCLVSGDRDLTDMKETNPPIKTPATFLAEVERQR